MYEFKKQQPPNGSRFVALFDDGSGANLFMRDDYGYYLSAEEGVPEELSTSYKFWIPIPMQFKLWFENHPGD